MGQFTLALVQRGLEVLSQEFLSGGVLGKVWREPRGSPAGVRLGARTGGGLSSTGVLIL